MDLSGMLQSKEGTKKVYTRLPYPFILYAYINFLDICYMQT